MKKFKISYLFKEYGTEDEDYNGRGIITFVARTEAEALKLYYLYVAGMAQIGIYCMYERSDLVIEIKDLEDKGSHYIHREESIRISYGN